MAEIVLNLTGPGAHFIFSQLLEAYPEVCAELELEKPSEETIYRTVTTLLDNIRQRGIYLTTDEHYQWQVSEKYEADFRARIAAKEAELSDSYDQKFLKAATEYEVKFNDRIAAKELELSKKLGLEFEARIAAKAAEIKAQSDIDLSLQLESKAAELATAHLKV